MENILVTTSLAPITEIAIEPALGQLSAGQFMAVADGKGPLGAGQVVPAGTREVQFLHKKLNGEVRSSVSIPLDNIVSINHQSPVTGVVRVLRTPVLVIPSIGEGNITLKNLSYNHTISTQRIVFSLEKKSTETPGAYIDRVVVGLNAAMALQSTPFCVVTKTGVGPIFTLTFTSSNTDVDLFVGVDGIFADFPPTVSVEGVAPIGTGKDVYNMEVDMSRHLGNGGYVENTNLWFKVTPEADVNVNYQISTITWRGIVTTPQSTKQVALNTLAIAYPTGLGASATVTFLNSLVTTKAATIIDVDMAATDGTNEEEPA